MPGHPADQQAIFPSLIFRGNAQVDGPLKIHDVRLSRRAMSRAVMGRSLDREDTLTASGC